LDQTLGRTIDETKKYMVSLTLDRVDWNAELLRGDLAIRLELGSGAVAMQCEPKT
jgi:hypothetical protein